MQLATAAERRSPYTAIIVPAGSLIPIRRRYPRCRRIWAARTPEPNCVGIAARCQPSGPPTPWNSATT